MTSIASLLNPAARDTDTKDFSLVLGGPLFQLLRRAHITGDALELVRRRIVVISLFAWLPLLLLSALAGELSNGSAAVPFIYDIQVHVRFLIAMPLLIVAEILVHQRLRPVVSEFLTRELIPEESMAAFHDAVRSALRWRNSIIAELMMIAIVYGIGVPVVWREMSFMSVPTWYAAPQPDGGGLTLAGTWYAYISVPIFQFMLLRWYYRMIIWMRFLWQTSRIRLNVSAMHGDRMAGLGFLAKTVYAFVPLAMAHGAILAGTIANRVLFLGAKLVDSQVEVAIVVAFLFILVFAPLAVFAPQVSSAKRAASKIYGRLAQLYVREFEAKWMPAGLPAADSLLGTGDIQSLADLANSMEVVRACRIVPITREAIIMLAVATLIPVSPLLLTVIPLEEVGKHLLKMLL
jgi:hypothetical protein